MKKSLLPCLFFILFYNAQAQKEAAIWYFGEHTGLDFNSGSPEALNDGQLVTEEGCAAISDSSGSLLFYTEGINVYNREHKVMPNGAGLKGHNSSTNSAIIVPKPGSTSMFYIFTTDAEFGPNGLQYSEVNMDLDNGLGDLTEIKNVLLETPVSEKLTAVKISGENAYYVLTHRGHSDEFLAYKISESGINANPVRSAIGPFITWPQNNSQGQIKISPNGKKLGVATQGLGFELYDFNSITGKITNYHQLFSDWSSYGLEFSPNSNFLYTSSLNYGVIQYSLKAGSATEIENSGIVLQDESYAGWGMQLAIDGKIYVATSTYNASNGNYLGVINNPNQQGAASNYERKGVFLGQKQDFFSLPPFIQSLFHIGGISVSNFCLGEATSFSLSVDVPVTNIKWDFGDGSSSTLENPTHTYASPGNYEVKVTVVSGLDLDTETKSVTIYPAPEAQQIAVVKLCASKTGSSFDLTTLIAEILATQPETDFGVSFFSSEADAIIGDDPLPYVYNITIGEESIYARIFYKSYSDCYRISEIKLKVSETPELQVVGNWNVCDPGGSFSFDLSEKTAEVLGNQDSNLFLVSYFESTQDAQENKNPISSIQVNAASGKSVYFRIQNKHSYCFQIGDFELQVGSGFISHTPKNLATCDEGDGFGWFDTSIWVPNVLNNQTGFKVSFFTENGTILPNPLPDYYRNSIPNTENIFARIENEIDPLCFSETSFYLRVNEKQELILQETYNLCDLEPFLNLKPEGNFDTWEWKNGSGTVISNTAEASLTAAGNYSVRVSKTDNGVTCGSSYAFRLIRSQLPSITEVKYQEWSSSNFIEIIAGGDGDLEYSIDGINFQDSNYFGNIPGGNYTVFARDRLGCGMASAEVVLIDYPKYFTPNNDGFHDRWQIKGIATQNETHVLIYDRYGKLLKEMSSLNQGWDGTFNGKVMPADDYWFGMTLEDGKTFKGHFSLIR